MNAVVPLKPAPDKDEKGRFAPGNTGGGRPKGSRNKLGEDFLSMLYDDFAANGIGTIAKVREADPVAYVQIIARLLPRQHTVETGNALESMSDAELEHIICAVRE